MTSALRPGGSTTRWRKIRRQVLDRDGWACRWPCPTDLDPDALCGAYADTCGHIVARHHGGGDELTNLRAECRRHNLGAGTAVRMGSPNVKAPPAHYRKAAWWTPPE